MDEAEEGREGEPTGNGSERLERVKAKLQPADRWVRRMARERPVATLAIAVGLGYLVGRLVSRD